MKRKYYWEWQPIDEESSRAEVPGGWLVKTVIGKNVSIVFIEDRDHTWLIVPRLSAVQQENGNTFGPTL